MITPHFYFKHHNQVNLTIHAKILCFINKYCCLFVTVVHKMTIYRFKRLYPLEILMYDLVQMHKDIYMYLLWGLFIVSFRKLNWYCLYVFSISFFLLFTSLSPVFTLCRMYCWFYKSYNKEFSVRRAYHCRTEIIKYSILLCLAYLSDINIECFCNYAIWFAAFLFGVISQPPFAIYG